VGGAPWPPGDGPTIAFLNHSAWWDPILTVYLSHDLFRRDGYGLMQGAQLLNYPFFRRVGCFGASTDSVEDVRGVALYAAQTLRGRRAAHALDLPTGGAAAGARAAGLPVGDGADRAGGARGAADPGGGALRVPGEPAGGVLRARGEAVRTDPDERPAALTRRLEQRLRRELEVLDADLAQPGVTPYRRRSTARAR
jgi:hypothetical protein